MGRISHVGIGSLAVVTALAITEAAYADPVKCERTIAEASAKFAQSKSKALQSCEDKKASLKLVATTDCHTEAKTVASIQKAVEKLASTVAKDCGGKDKRCGTADDDALPTIGWGAVGACPNFEGGSCTGPITDCNDIADCIACVDEAAVDQAITLYYGDLADEQFGTGSVVNKCQRAIGKETTKFLQAKSKALQKCWDERMKGKHENDCPDPGDGKAVDAIAKAEGKKVSAICKACGGPDKVCGGGDDLSPSDIGFPSDCPSVTIPDSASSCGGAILDLQDVVDCVDCVTEFKVDCMDRLAVPQFVPYPPECAGSTSTTTSTQAPTTTTPTTSTTSTTAPELCGNGMVDPGEPCDPSSPGGAFLCAPGEVCTAACTCASTTTTSTTPSTTTTTLNLCGNGMVDPGEPCDPSSPGGAFLCAPGEVCTAACTCASTTTTSTEAPTTTSTTSTTLNLCGNGMVDPGEPCDPSSPGGAFLCAPGEVCTAACTCASTTTTSTEAPTTTTPTTTSTTSTTLNLCGNGMVDPGEPCDPSSPGGAFLCAPGEVCTAACTCASTTTTSTEAPTTTLAPTTTSSSTTEAPTTSSTSSTETPTTSTTSTTQGYGSPSRAFLVEPGGLLD